MVATATSVLDHAGPMPLLGVGATGQEATDQEATGQEGSNVPWIFAMVMRCRSLTCLTSNKTPSFIIPIIIIIVIIISCC